MGQHWKTLGLVVVGAAIAGWLMVRVLGNSSSRRAASPTATIADPQLPQAAIVAADANTPIPTTNSAAPITATAPPNDADEAALIESELMLLAQGLQKDKWIEAIVMPPVDIIFDQPSMTDYRRPADFWESALASSQERKP